MSRAPAPTLVYPVPPKNLVQIFPRQVDHGKSTNFDVLNRQEDLRQAELRKTQALIDWHKAELVVQALTGDLLPMYGITLD